MTDIVERLDEEIIASAFETGAISSGSLSERLILERRDARDEIARLRAEVERLRAALEAWMDAVRIDVVMEGPQYMGVSSTLGRKAWELTCRILGEQP